MKKQKSKNIKLVIETLQNEVDGNIYAAMQKLSMNYSMTWAYKHPKNKQLFPRTENNIKSELKKVYPIKGRRYEIINIAEGNNVVMVELIENYPDPKTKKIYRTPIVIVLEIKGNKINTGRHYCDPNLSYLHLNESKLNKLYKNKKVKQVIKRK